MGEKVMRNVLAGLLVLLVGILLLTACGAPVQPDGNGETVVQTVIVQVRDATVGYGETLKAVLARGRLVCGVNAQLLGFGAVDADGNFSGLEVDYCRALAAAIFGDASRVEFRAVTVRERFTALQAGEIDVLSRNTSWSLVRDTELNGNFVRTLFYDGQGIMARQAAGIVALTDLNDTMICVQAETSAELNLSDVLAVEGISYTPLVFEDADLMLEAYASEQCDALTMEKSALIARRVALADPENHTILDVTISKEPLGPMVRHGDDQWFDIVQWTVFALFAGEEFGITSANVDAMLDTATNPEIRRLLGVEGELGPKLGLSVDWAYHIFKAVGNYEEVYNRNLGPNTPAYLPRGLNKLYTDGGLLYAPPFR
jgi:general L-amino acid transport system substrate-binding protein